MIQVVQLEGPLWGIESSHYVKTLNEEARRTPGMRFDKFTRTWVGYADAVHVTAKRAHARGLLIAGGIEPTPPTGFLVARKGLRDYQQTGVDFLVAKAHEGALLADDMGLGKSCQAVTAARAFREKTVVVCLNLARGVWLDEVDGEIVKWWPKANFLGLCGTKPCPIVDPDNPTRPVDVAVVHFDILHAWVDALIAWGVRTLIIDEIHACMGDASRRTKVMRKLAAACRYRMGLSGTPMEGGRIKDLWAPVDLLSPGVRRPEEPIDKEDKPPNGRFGGFVSFAVRYCDAHQEQIEVREEGVKVHRKVWAFNGKSNVEELRERLEYSASSPWGFMLRRLKSDVSLELPARQRQVLVLEVPRDFIASTREIRSDRVLRQALDLAADGKFPQVVELAVNHLKEGRKVVVGSYRRHIAEMLAKAIRRRSRKTVAVVHGEIELSKRQTIVKGKPDCLCCTLDSTKAAINLSFAHVAIIAELVWVPSTIEQWENRFGRFKGENILIQICVARGTADDMIRRVVLDKLGTSQKAIGKSDSNLLADLEGKEGAVERMTRLYERIMAQSSA